MCCFVNRAANVGLCCAQSQFQSYQIHATFMVRAEYKLWCPLACFPPGWITKVQHSVCCWLVTPSSASPLGCTIAGGWWKCLWEEGIQVPVCKKQLIFFSSCETEFVFCFGFSESIWRYAGKVFSVFDVNNLGMQDFGFSGRVLLVLQCKRMGMSAVLC